MKVVLVYNPASGSEYGLRHIRSLFKKHGVSIDYHFTIQHLNSKKLAILLKQGVTVAVVGGDGTLNAVARRVTGTKSVLLPLPGGTFNHFVRDIGMPATIDEIVAHLKDAKIRKIDVGYVNDELFLNNSNIGLYPFSLIERKHTKRLLGKWLAAALSAVDQLSVFRRHHLVIDGERIRSPFVFVGNNVYDIKQSLIPQRMDLSRQTLTVMIATSDSRRALMRAIVSVMRGDVSGQDDFTLSYRPTMTIYSSRHSLPVSYDGEVKRLTPPLAYRIAPRSLNVMIVERP